ncbi:MAG: hypothetical protein ACI8PT_000807 [Gammaproteobacteria bacterium]|jgi:hypothetical protein
MRTAIVLFIAILASQNSLADATTERVAQREVSTFIRDAKPGTLEALVAVKCARETGWSATFICIRKEMMLAHLPQNPRQPPATAQARPIEPSPLPKCKYRWKRDWYGNTRTQAYYSGRISNHEHFRAVYIELWDADGLLDDGWGYVGPTGAFKVFISAPRRIRGNIEPRFLCEP